MFFKNAQVYRLPENWRDHVDLTALDAQLCAKAFRPCGPMDMESRGWVSPTGGFEHLHAVGAHWLICLQTEAKLMPAAVVKEEAARRAEEIAERQGYKLGRKQMKELREQVSSELLPKAFSRTRKTFAWIDPVGGWLVVDAPSQNRAEDVLEVLRHTLDIVLPLSMLRTERSPTSSMADWLTAGEAPAGFAINADCTLQSITEDKRTVTYRNGLDDEQIRAHLEAGKLPTKLALTFDERVSFVLTEKFEVKRIDFLDVVKDKLDEHGAEDARALFDAGFALMAGELARLVPALVAAMGGELKREPDLVDGAAQEAPHSTGPDVGDPLYPQAKQVVKQTGRPSISLVQRLLLIGYNRAARLIEQMEKDGLVTPVKMGGAREVIEGAW